MLMRETAHEREWRQERNKAFAAWKAATTTLDEAARLLGLAESTVLRRARKDRAASYQRDGAPPRVKWRWISERLAGAAREPEGQEGTRG